MGKSKIFFIVAFISLTVCLFSTKTSCAQSEKFIGKWVITPERTDNLVSHITISKKGNGFEISRTKAPDEKTNALFDLKNQKMVAILGNKMVYFTHDSITDHLLSFDSETNKKLFELKKE
jgi:hypothetical protein